MASRLLGGGLMGTLLAVCAARNLSKGQPLNNGVVLLAHEAACGDQRTLDQWLADVGAFEDGIDMKSVGREIKLLTMGVKTARTSESADLTKDEISGLDRRLSEFSPEARRDLIIAALEVAARRATGSDGGEGKAWQQSKLSAKYLTATKIEIVRDSYGVGDERFLKLAQKLPCMKIEPEADIGKEPQYNPNDPQHESQWYLEGGPGGIYGTRAWDLFSGSEGGGVDVAVVDSGCSMHPDIEPNIYQSVAPECNGTKVAQVSECNGYDFGDDDPNPFNEPLQTVHGTPVVGLIAGRPNNGHSVAGLCWDCKIHCLKVWNSEYETLPLSAILMAHDYILRNKVKISNHSYGGYGYSGTEELSIMQLGEAGHLFVAAAGNEGCNIDKPDSKDDDACKNSNGEPRGLFTPAGYDLPNILSVCATNSEGHLEDFSNFGQKNVDLCAPGKSVLSLWNTIDDPSGVKKVSGTSFSSPLVVGAAALIWGSSPSKEYLQIKQALMDTITTSDSLNGVSRTGGILNAHRALDKYGTNYADPHPVEEVPSEDNSRDFYDPANLPAGSMALSVSYMVLIFIVCVCFF